jgi:hypothetical protein
MTTNTEERGTLPLGQPHPAAEAALAWVRKHSVLELLGWAEAFAIAADYENLTGEVCGETLRRLLEGEPVSDRYLLGLVWVMREGTE